MAELLTNLVSTVMQMHSVLQAHPELREFCAIRARRWDLGQSLPSFAEQVLALAEDLLLEDVGSMKREDAINLIFNVARRRRTDYV